MLPEKLGIKNNVCYSNQYHFYVHSANCMEEGIALAAEIQRRYNEFRELVDALQRCIHAVKNGLTIHPDALEDNWLNRAEKLTLP